MAHPYMHARSSAKKLQGVPEDYVELHAWFDQTKAAMPDVRHRAILHHAFGIFLHEQFFGVIEQNKRLLAQLQKLPEEVRAKFGLELPTSRPVVWTRESDGKPVPIRLIGEQHVKEDCGFIPTIENWLDGAPPQGWMITGARPLSKELGPE